VYLKNKLYCKYNNMISSNDKEIEHFRGGGGGGGRGGGGGFGGSRGGYSGYGGISRGLVNNSSVDRNANIGYRGDYYGGNNDGYGWNNYPLIYNNYIPVDPNDNDNNTVLLPPEITENFNNGGCNNQVSVVWYLISIILVLFIIYRN
jgi:hypothetical protein